MTFILETDKIPRCQKPNTKAKLLGLATRLAAKKKAEKAKARRAVKS